MDHSSRLRLQERRPSVLSQSQMKVSTTKHPEKGKESPQSSISVGETPKPELTSNHKGAALIGNPVVLYCKLDQSAGWRLYRSKHTQSPENETKTETHSYTISSVSISDGGQYWCRAGRGISRHPCGLSQ
ncbi:hypothetical protein SRHO_G00028490 [Serrasalmus rhombeus]